MIKRIKLNYVSCFLIERLKFIILNTSVHQMVFPIRSSYQDTVKRVIRLALASLVNQLDVAEQWSRQLPCAAIRKFASRVVGLAALLTAQR